MKLDTLPLVSVIAICHGHKNYVIQTLESIRNQNYPNLEFLIINNLKDDCEKIIENWIYENKVKCLFIQNEKPKSLVSNLNFGIERISGEFFQGISCDDILDENKFTAQIELFLKLDHNFAAVYSDMVYIDENGQELGRRNFDIFPDAELVKANPVNFLLRSGKVIPAPTLLLKTEIIRKIGGYPKDWIFEDWPLYLKLAQLGYQFKFIDKNLVFYRVLRGSFGHNQSKESISFCLSIFEKNQWNYNKNDAFQVSKWFSFVCRMSHYSLWLSLKKLFFFIKYNRINIKFLIKFIAYQFKAKKHISIM